jgi:hypothetical protein
MESIYMLRHIPRMTLKGISAALLVIGVMIIAPMNEAVAACRGAWAEGVNYAAGDTVTYNGSVYTARVAHGCNGCGWNPVAAPSLWSLGGTCDTTPTPTPTPTATVRPSPTPTATMRPTPTPTVRPTPTPTSGPGCFAAWVSTTVYTGGAQVSRNNVNYQAAYWTQGNDPASSSGPAGSGQPWISMGVCGGATPTPTPTVRPTPTPTTTVRPTPTPTVRPTPTPTTTGTPTPTVRPTPPPGGRVFAPYIDMSLRLHDLASISAQSGTREFTLAFVVDTGGCRAGWGGTGTTLPNDTLSDGTTMAQQISNIRAAGGDVIVSFGGAAGTELGTGCTTVSALQAQYQSVIDKYNARRLDFDIEGGQLSNTAAIDRRNQALAALQAANPGLDISYTLPVAPFGLTQPGINLLVNARTRGVNITTVNIMTMDYGGGADPNRMGDHAISASNGTIAQMDANGINARLGITPMIGVNDVRPETFTVADARQVLSYAQGNSRVRVLSFWQVGRDNGNCAAGTLSNTCSGTTQTPWDFAHTFQQLLN